MKFNEDEVLEKLALQEKQLQRKTTELDSMRRIGIALSSELNIERLLVIVMDVVNELMNSERSSFYIVDEERGELWSKIAQKAEVKEIRLKIGTGIAGHVAKTGEVINIPDAYKDSRFDPSTDKRTGYRTHSILCMPIFESLKDETRKPKIVGVLQILNKKEGVFDSSDEDLLAGLASQIAISINNSRLYNILEKKVNELNLLYDIEMEVGKAYNLDELLIKLITKITGTLKVEAALLTMYDHQTREFSNRVGKNIDIQKLEDAGISPDASIAGEVIRSGTAYFTNNALSDKFFDQGFSKLTGIQIVQAACTPLKIGNDVIGVIEVFNKTERDDFFRAEDIVMINSLASQISRIIETYRLREEKMKEDRLAAIGNMMSTIVHDLRTPMNNIYGFVDLMVDENGPDVRKEYAEIVIQQIKSLNNMTTDVLDFAKGKTTILPVKCPVNKLLDEFVRVFAEDVKKKGYHFQSECKTASMIYVDKEKISRVFMNIMKNAIEAMEPGGTFSIVADELNGEVKFSLSDTGKGIPVEIQDKLFDSFVTSGKEGGTGLGLAIVKKMVDQHHGRIEVESKPGRGTTFNIYLKRL
ncbi:MAG: GAF domain-containing protein [Calditrichaceae bacterium]